jgi:Xaa-Pro dipeptidase
MEKIKNEFLSKAGKIRKLIADTGTGGIEVGLQTNFSWLTGGRGFVGLASEDACASLLISTDSAYLLVNNIEKPRLLDEEISGLADMLQVGSYPWYDGAQKASVIQEVLNGREFLTDVRLQKEFRSLRSRLTDTEAERYRILGKDAAEAVEDVCRGLKPGVREFEIAGIVSGALWSRGIEPITVLIAFDERLCNYRHPLPTDKKLVKYAMIAVCARRHGLVASLSRLASIGAVSGDIEAKHRAVARVDACFIISTRPGARAKDIFKEAVLTYGRTGFGSEWELHHQGGLTGYSAREYVATPDSTDIVEAGQAFAWNPSITGTKSEDTIIVEPDGNRIITHTGKYAYLEAEYRGEKVLRPGILVL